MFNFLIKKIKIPTSSRQEVNELQSWTVTWEIQANGYCERITFNKVFIKQDEAKEFEKQLKDAATFLGTWVDVSIKEN